MSRALVVAALLPALACASAFTGEGEGEGEGEGGPFVALNDPCGLDEECLEGQCFPPLGPCVSGPQPPRCDGDGVCDLETQACIDDACGDALCVALCATDDDCGPGESCHGDPLACRPARCDADGFACAADQACDLVAPGADLHGCRTARCDADGFACPLGDCDPGAFAVDVHGCAVADCAADADCTTDRCVAGTCRPRVAGTCLLEPPPPPP